jgi:hypothetical protein
LKADTAIGAVHKHLHLLVEAGNVVAQQQVVDRGDEALRIQQRSGGLLEGGGVGEDLGCSLGLFVLDFPDHAVEDLAVEGGKLAFEVVPGLVIVEGVGVESLLDVLPALVVLPLFFVLDDEGEELVLVGDA